MAAVHERKHPNSPPDLRCLSISGCERRRQVTGDYFAENKRRRATATITSAAGIKANDEGSGMFVT